MRVFGRESGRAKGSIGCGERASYRMSSSTSTSSNPSRTHSSRTASFRVVSDASHPAPIARLAALQSWQLPASRPCRRPSSQRRLPCHHHLPTRPVARRDDELVELRSGRGQISLRGTKAGINRQSQRGARSLNLEPGRVLSPPHLATLPRRPYLELTSAPHLLSPSPDFSAAAALATDGVARERVEAREGQR